MSTLELKVPPVALVLVVGLAMWALARAVPAAALAVPMAGWLGAFLAVAGIAVSVAGVMEFRRAQTTVNPTRPHAASSMVTSGIYRRTRNPMYLGMLLVLAGWAFFLRNVAALALLPVFVLLISRLQIQPEERALGQSFADEYERYRRSVRRWI